MVETDKYEAWGCDPNPDWMVDVRAREAAKREACAIQAAVDAATDDWALALKDPTEGRAEWLQAAVRIQDRRRELIAALDAEGPVPVVITAYTWRVTRHDKPAKVTVVDVNREERESWVAWARRKHPEWGDNPKPPRRLAPSWRTQTVSAKVDAAEAVFITFSEETPRGCPHCVENGLLSETHLDEWDEIRLLSTEEYRLAVKEPWDRRYFGDMDCTDIVNGAVAQARYFVLQKKCGDRYRGERSRAVAL